MVEEITMMIEEKGVEEDKIIPKKTIGCRIKPAAFFIDCTFNQNDMK